MRRNGLRLLLLLAASGVGLGILEVGVRVSGRGDEPLRFDPRFEVGEDRWALDFHVPPGADTVQIREQIIPVKKRPGETRVLFVGDSGTKGSYVPITESFPLVFGALARERNPGVSVINAGVWGMTTVDEYRFLRDRLLPLSPDVVVLGLFMANDINFNLAHPVSRPSVTPLFDRFRAHSALARFLFVHALAWNERFGWVRGEIPHVPVEFGLVDRRGLHMLNYPAGELATYLPPTSLMDRAYGVLGEFLRRFRALGEERGFRVRVLLVPTPSAVTGQLNILRHPRILDELEARGVSVDPRDLDFGRPTRRVLAMCAELEIPCTDPTRRLSRLGLAAFMPNDEHPSSAGHRVLAESLVSTLSSP